MDCVTAYAEKVTSGKIVAGKNQINACKRHLRDLKNQGKKSFPFFFDEQKAQRAINFFNKLTIGEGFEKKILKLKPFQQFIVGSLFGWITTSGFRRFRISYIEMARQNGKSMLNGGCGSFIAIGGGYKHGQMYCCATKQAQSKIVWNEIKKFIKSDDDLSKLFKIKEYNSTITCQKTDCTIEALSKERQKLDGFRGIWASIDEIHQHKDNSVYKAVLNGTGSLDETLISMITTAGDDVNSFCFEMHRYAENVASGALRDESFFSLIFDLDKDDDYFDKNVYIKANPFLAGTEKGLELLCQDAQRAKEMGGFDLRDFLTKRLNVWVQNAHNQYVSAEDWKNCGSHSTLENFKGSNCFVGLDLSSGGDLTTLSIEIPLGGDKFYVYSHSFMPRKRLNQHLKTDLAPYDLWSNQGLLTVTDTFGGVKNDYKFIISHLKEIEEKYDLKIQGIGYDPHNADGFLQDLEVFGCPLVEIRQSARFLNDATVDFALCVEGGNIEYDKRNELLSWSMLNAKTTRNSFGEIKVDKEVNARTKRIDPVDSIIDAHVLTTKKPEKDVDFEKSANDYFDILGW